MTSRRSISAGFAYSLCALVLGMLAACLERPMTPAAPTSRTAATAPGGTSDPKASPRQVARENFSRAVMTWAAWAGWLLTVAGLLLLVASLTRLGPLVGVTFGEGISILAAGAGVPLVQYLLLAWGTLAMDTLAILAGVTMIAAVIVAGVVAVRRIRRSRKL